MWAVYSLLILLALLVVFLCVPVSGRVAYTGCWLVRLRVLGIPITLAPSGAKERPRRRTQRAAKKKSPPAGQKPSKWRELRELMRQDSLGATLSLLRDVAALAGRTASRVLRAVTVPDFSLHILVASEDAATTAERYGQVCSVVYPALALLARRVKIRRRRVRIEPNFLLEQGAARFDVRFRVAPWRLVGAGFSLLWGILLLRQKDAPPKQNNRPQKMKEVS